MHWFFSFNCIKSSIICTITILVCRNPGLALPLIALQYHEVKFNLEFETSDVLFGKAGNGSTEAKDHLQSMLIYGLIIFISILTRDVDSPKYLMNI